MSDTPRLDAFNKAYNDKEEWARNLGLWGFACQLEQENAELRADSGRLDWLDENMSYVGGGDGGTYSFRTPADVESGLLREAIDAARKESP